MKDLYNHQKSMNYGVNRLKRRLCRVSSKVKNTNHNLMGIGHGHGKLGMAYLILVHITEEDYVQSPVHRVWCIGAQAFEISNTHSPVYWL